jgi:dephospho-CoA kinase
MSRKIIGLTGGISTGKTTVSDYLSTKYQLPVLDADFYAREAVKKDTPLLNKIIQRYGDNILLPDKTLDRQKLGNIIFHDPQEKIWIESQIHPYVREALLREINDIKSPIIVLVIPLLFEANMTDLVTEIWVVSCEYDQQIQRLMARNQLTLEEAQTRIENQWPLDQKIIRADFILDNSSTTQFLLQQVDQYMENNHLDNITISSELIPPPLSGENTPTLANVLLDSILEPQEIENLQELKNQREDKFNQIVFIDQSDQSSSIPSEDGEKITWVDYDINC